LKSALVISDTHLEYDADGGKEFLSSLPTEAIDMVVAAGDICSFSMMERVLKSLSDKFEDVVYLYGNHECWHSSIRSVSEKAARLEASIDNLHVLDASKRAVAGVNFVGAPLWFSDAHPDATLLSKWLNDFDLVANFRRQNPSNGWDVFSQNEKAESFLRQNVEESSVVVTHHLPHPMSISPEFKGDRTNVFFLHDMSDLIEEAQPRVWVHGHTHTSCEYRVGKTRVICNPRGYSFAPNYQFQWRIVELDDQQT
jgi:Icc-related predicted phosphoesterase